jgi:hypothetical protein
VRSRGWVAPVLTVVLLAGGCGGIADEAAGTVALQGEIEVDADRPGTCDALDPAHCLLPFPSDFFTEDDGDTPTGRRVAFPKRVTPANVEGVRIDPAEWNRSDGFSPGPMILTHVPGLDPVASGVPPSTDIGASPELDANATTDEERLLIVRPAINLLEGHRHVVALRGAIIDGAGEPIPPSDAFRAYRDKLDTGDDALEDRRDAMEQIFTNLDDAGIERDDLWLAWDFTVASRESLSGRLLHMRDDAFDALDGKAPDFTVESVEEDGAARVVRGTYEVPSYLDGDGGPGSTLNNGDGDDSPLPKRNGTITANFVCTVPTSASADNLARWGLFGHGLLGTAEATVSVGELAANVNAGFCGTDWIGMSESDLPFLGRAIQEMTLWRAVPDRLQQSHLNFLVLGRLLTSKRGLGTDAAFQDAGGANVIDRDQIFFVGGSQGGILGGATSAVATDWDRAFLAVPGLNYSLLLDRSSQYEAFEPIFAEAYPDLIERELALGLVQMLWDRGENAAYAQHLTTDPYRDTPKKKILLFEAFGDHQVANVSTEVLARTIGARVRQPALAPGRSNDVDPFFGLEAVPEFPYDGSALVVWDYGTPAPPIDNRPPTEGADPHGNITSTIPAVLMASDFLKTGGTVTDPCMGQPCRT